MFRAGDSEKIPVEISKGVEHGASVEPPGEEVFQEPSLVEDRMRGAEDVRGYETTLHRHIELQGNFGRVS